MLLLCTSGEGDVGRDPLRILWMLLLSDSAMTCPAFGAAVTIVPGVALGGGVGESLRNNG